MSFTSFLKKAMALSIFCMLCHAAASDLDPFATKSQVAKSQLQHMMPEKEREDPCQFSRLSTPLGLMEAVERALCSDPQARQAWADVKYQAAQVGLAETAFIPTLNAESIVDRETGQNLVRNLPTLSYRTKIDNRNIDYEFSWTLFDFGLRSAALRTAQQLLMAANATQDATLQNIFASTAQAYYQMLSTQGALVARMEQEHAAYENFQVAEARYKLGAGTLADKLQAQTNYAQASLDRVKAEGDLKSARGALVVSIGLPADTIVTLDDSNLALPGEEFSKSVKQLMDEALLQHPSLIAAQANLKAAQENVAATRAEGMPTVGLVASATRSNQIGQYPRDTFVKNNVIGIQVQIPLLDFVGHSYRLSAARAQEEKNAAALTQTERQIALGVWNSYQVLETENTDVRASEQLLHTAEESYKVAQGRYKAGIGSIIELITAQTSVTNAQQQQVQAVANWRTARLNLALSLGKLGFWTIQ